jgi:hypothetical protein
MHDPSGMQHARGVVQSELAQVVPTPRNPPRASSQLPGSMSPQVVPKGVCWQHAPRMRRQLVVAQSVPAPCGVPPRLEHPVGSRSRQSPSGKQQASSAAACREAQSAAASTTAATSGRLRERDAAWTVDVTRPPG